MKRQFVLMTAALLLGVFLTGCAGEEAAWVPALGEYVYEDSEDVLPPSLTLLEEGECRFFYSPLSSYLPWGNHRVEEDRLICTIEEGADGAPVYVFERSGENLVYKAEDSTPLPDYTDIPEGAVFVWQTP